MTSRCPAMPARSGEVVSDQGRSLRQPQRQCPYDTVVTRASATDASMRRHSNLHQERTADRQCAVQGAEAVVRAHLGLHDALHVGGPAILAGDQHAGRVDDSVAQHHLLDAVAQDVLDQPAQALELGLLLLPLLLLLLCKSRKKPSASATAVTADTFCHDHHRSSTGGDVLWCQSSQLTGGMHGLTSQRVVLP